MNNSVVKPPEYNEAIRLPTHIPIKSDGMNHIRIATHLAPPVYMPPRSPIKIDKEDEEDCCILCCMKYRL